MAATEAFAARDGAITPSSEAPAQHAGASTPVKATRTLLPWAITPRREALSPD
jgi:hypothetical protein